MDYLGDADEIGPAEQTSARDTFFTPETLALTAAAVVLLSCLIQQPLQLLNLVLYNPGLTFDTRGVWAVSPSVVIPAVGAWLGMRARRDPLTPALHGLAGAAVVVGVAVAVLNAIAYPLAIWL